VLQRDLCGASEFLTDHRSHRASHEVKFKGYGNHRQAAHGTMYRDDGIALVAVLGRLGQTIAIFFGIAELEVIDRFEPGAKL